MSEPQSKSVHELMKPATPTTAEQVNQEEQVPITLPSSDNNDNQTEQTTTTTTTTNDTTTELSGDIKTLKDAFPDLDIDVIETILASQGGNLDAAFEVLLGMSDPSYKPEPGQSEGMDQLRRDEEYARRLAREGDAHYPQNNTQQQQAEQPLFNFQEELPIIKEKVIEAGTAAKNKIMSLYNQFMAPDQAQQQQGQSSQGGILESGIGNLSLSDNQASPQQQQQQQRYTAPLPQQQARPSPPTATSGSVDLYEWDGNKAPQSPVRNPLLSQRKESATSTPAEQMLSDEEFARQLAREDAEASSHVATSNAITTTTPPPPPATTTANANTTAATAANVPPTTTTSTQNAKSSASSDNEEVTFSALGNESEKATKPGYTHTANDDDDLDDLFDKQDSSLDLSVEPIDSVDKETAKTSSQK
ncbi:uncharacterized protein ATC70_008774 [Mucor velutinosus]|uniref:CUE domain-containing protein n=1 Tax=Mucor velutinosus TaxID=708070 RepID=A0AAN7HUR8_9FUNG|nr:hypothetical protein ATC70_008774 [Mucor velutinosus]